MKKRRTKEIRSPGGPGRPPRGQFLPGTAPGPGRPSLKVELANLRAITGVLNTEAFIKLANLKLKKALHGDESAFRWCEKRGLGEADLAALHKAEGLEPAADLAEEADRKKGVLALNEEVLQEELLRLLKKARKIPLTETEAARVLEIRKVLVKATAADKLPDLSGLDPAAAEEELFQPRAEEKKK